MNTHWFSFKRKTLKRASANLARLAGALLMLAGLMGPAVVQPQKAEAGLMNWERGTTVQKTSGAPFSGVAVAIDGTIFAVNGPGTGAAAANRVFRSNDGGKSWTNCGDLAGTVAGNTLDIVASPKYNEDSTIFVVVSGAAGSTGFVNLSTNNCTSFTASPALTSGIAVSLGVHPTFSGRDGGVIVVGTRGTVVAGAQVQTNQITSGGAFGVWTNTTDATAPTVDDTVLAVMVNRDGSFARWTGCGVTGATTTCTGAAGARPGVIGQMAEDRATATGTWANGVVAPFTAFTSGAATAAAAADAAAGTPVTTGGSLNTRVRVARPSDIERDGRNYFFSVGGASTVAGTAASGNGIYKRDGAVTGGIGVATATKPGDFATKFVGASLDVTGIAVRGTFDTGTIMGALRSHNTVKSTNGGSTWGSTKDMDPTDAPALDDAATAAGWAHYVDIAFDPNNTALAYAVSTARPANDIGGSADGGILWSTTGGDSWGDTQLNNRDRSDAMGSFSAINDQTIQSRAGSSAAFVRQMFESTSQSVVSGAIMTSAWRRILRWGDTSTVTRSPNYDTDGTAIIYRSQATTDSSKVQKTSDKGASWRNCGVPGDKKINDRDAWSATTMIVGDDDGFFWMSTDGCSSWTRSDTDIGQRVNSSGPYSKAFDKNQTIFATGVDTSGNVQAFWSKDAGKTWSQIGSNNGTWGTCTACNPAPTTSVTPDKQFDTNGLLYFKSNAQSIIDLWRFDTTKADSVWVRLYAPGGSGVAFATGSPRYVGNNMMISWRNAVGQVPQFNYNYRTTDSTTQNKDWWTSDGIPAGIGLGNGALPAVSAITTTSTGDGTMLLARVGATIPDATFMLTLGTDFLKGLTLGSPGDKATVPSNIGQNGQPVVFSWNSFASANCYEIQVALEAKFDSVTGLGAVGATCATAADTATVAAPAIQGVATPASALSSGTNVFSDGVTYYWRTRVLQTNINGQILYSIGPWSSVRSFTPGLIGAPTAPQPNLPLNGTQLPGLTTDLSWNNPGGTSQVQVQIIPLANDGPAINLIIGAAISSYTVPAPVFGTGPYVILPGAGYSWRIRTSRSIDPGIKETDSSWGPWSDPRGFTTRRPDSGTIQLVDPINGKTVSGGTPAVTWKNAATDEFYYEVQLSADPNFNMNPGTATAAVFWNLLHGGQSTPPNSWKVPDANSLKPGTYYWRVRQRLQATPAGSAETGVAWSPAQRFVVQ